jgi:hypothetical protein
MKNIFEPEITEGVISRINKLKPETQRNWGKMTVSQMLAHCCVPYEMVYDNIHPIAGELKTFFMKLLIKNTVVGTKPYKHNSPTAPAFYIKDERDFEKEKGRLVTYLKKTQELGSDYFDGKKSNSFGKLTDSEWNVLFYKHIDHHLTQFGV